MSPRARAGLATVLVTLNLMSLGTASARAETAVDRATDARRAAVADVRSFRRSVDARDSSLRSRIDHARRLLHHGPGAGLPVSPDRWAGIRREAISTLRESRDRRRALAAWGQRRLVRLRDARDDVQTWLATYGIFQVCPVPDHKTIADNFGYTVRIPGVPVHVHQGNDIAAPTGTPILAPFDGEATASTNDLGGLTVDVRGPRGYVYNAHLSSLGTLGHVEAGTVVGYVGSTGDATGPHDHLEWHPWNGPATDPHDLLVAACVDLPEPGAG